MKTKIHLIAILMLIVLYSCNNSDSVKQASVVADTLSKQKIMISGKASKEKNLMMDSLISLIKTNGDTNAYNKVHVYYAERLRDQEILNLSIIMAHKFKYNYAYFTVYTTLVNQENNGLKDLDSQTKNLALYYLFRSYELGYKDALYTIHDDLGEKAAIQKSSYYLNKMIEFDSKKD